MIKAWIRMNDSKWDNNCPFGIGLFELRRIDGELTWEFHDHKDFTFLAWGKSYKDCERQLKIHVKFPSPYPLLKAVLKRDAAEENSDRIPFAPSHWEELDANSSTFENL